MRRERRRPSPGLPRPLERYLLRGHDRTLAQRMKSAAAVRAIGVLVRHHPGAVAEALGAGVVRAGRVGVSELRDSLERRERKALSAPEGDEPPAVPRRRRGAPLSPEDRRRLIRFLEQEARRARRKER